MSFEPVWTSDAWKNARDTLLKSECEQCGSSEKLVLMHTWKPPKFRYTLFQLQREWVLNQVDLNIIPLFDETLYKQLRDSCIQCSSLQLSFRKTKSPPYRCKNCKHEFEKPEKIEVIDDYVYNKAYKNWIEEQSKHELTSLLKQAEQIHENYSNDYKSGKGTVTFCKKCQFLWTQKGMKLCNLCKTSYHKKNYEQCFNCNSVKCQKCNVNNVLPQPGDLNICDPCYEVMWKEDFG
jgi:hypothetical protein